MIKESLLSAEVKITIPFHDCDPMNVVWHGNYARYLEVARCELLTKLDYNYNQMEESGYCFPIVDMRIKYVDSVRFLDEIVVQAHLVEYESRIKIKYLILSANDGKKLTKADTIQVAVEISSKEMLFQSPDILINKVLTTI